jgi:DNA modification methylase
VSVVILRGDAACLPLPDASVDLICTSPPYWGKRDYLDQGKSMPGQIGAEETPAEYVAALLACTREWMRVLKPEGSLFVNLDDCYAARADGSAGRTWREDRAEALPPVRNTTGFVRRKSLMNLPHRYAISCTDELGLVQRAGIVWSKPSSMPESVRDRVQASHEFVFHFTKRERYFEAVDEIRRPLAAPRRKAGRSAFGARDVSIPRASTGAYDGQNPLGAVPGSVWEIAAEPLSVPEYLAADHYAAYPTALARQVILGWSPSGICTECGEGRRPVTHVERVQLRPGDRPGAAGLNSDQTHGFDRRAGTHVLSRNTITGYACACPDASAPTTPAVALDPFGGTGTTALVASTLGRIGVTNDRSADYCRIAAWRCSDPAERAKALQVPKPPPVPEGQGSLFDEREAAG